MNDSIALTSSFHITEATLDDADIVVEVSNDAFLVDAFFRKTEYLNRFTKEDIQKLIQEKHSYWLLAIRDSDLAVLGCVHLHIDIQPEGSSASKAVSTIFSSVSALPFIFLIDDWTCFCSFCTNQT
jgi:hypothetical protein